MSDIGLTDKHQQSVTDSDAHCGAVHAVETTETIAMLMETQGV